MQIFQNGTPPRIKIVLADDHTLFRKGLIELLNKDADVETIGEAANGQEAVETIYNIHPDILLLELEMPVLSGFEVLIKLQQQKSPVKRLVVSHHSEQLVIGRAMEYGANGFVHKSVEPDEILRAIHTVNMNNVYISRQLETGAVNKITGKEQLHFTDKEIKILQFLGEGLTSKAIGASMFLSPRTIEDIRQNMMQKAEVHCVASLVQFALKNGII